MPVAKLSRTVLAASKAELAASVAFWQQRGWRVASPPRLESGPRNPHESWSQDLEYGTKMDAEHIVIPASKTATE